MEYPSLKRRRAFAPPAGQEHQYNGSPDFLGPPPLYNAGDPSLASFSSFSLASVSAPFEDTGHVVSLPPVYQQFFFDQFSVAAAAASVAAPYPPAHDIFDFGPQATSFEARPAPAPSYKRRRSPSPASLMPRQDHYRYHGGPSLSLPPQGGYQEKAPLLYGQSVTGPPLLQSARGPFGGAEPDNASCFDFGFSSCLPPGTLDTWKAICASFQGTWGSSHELPHNVPSAYSHSGEYPRHEQQPAVAPISDSRGPTPAAAAPLGDGPNTSDPASAIAPHVGSIPSSVESAVAPAIVSEPPTRFVPQTCQEPTVAASPPPTTSHHSVTDPCLYSDRPAVATANPPPTPRVHSQSPVGYWVGGVGNGAQPSPRDREWTRPHAGDNNAATERPRVVCSPPAIDTRAFDPAPSYRYPEPAAAGIIMDLVPRPQRPVSTRRGPFRDNATREKTAQTRKMGSCIRCKMQRIRCEFDPDEEFGPCLTCQKVASGKVWRLPCLRYKITDIKLNKPGMVRGFEWSRRWCESIPDDISTWASTEIRTVEITNGFVSSASAMRLRVRRFVPQPGDRLERSWVWCGQERSVDVPPYAVMHLDELQSACGNFVDRGIAECVRTVLARDGGGSLLRETYGLAWRLAGAGAVSPAGLSEEAETLMLGFRLWVAVRCTSTTSFIAGAETLGMPRDIMDETSSIPGKLPLPPVMGAQVDLMMTQILVARLRKDLLLRLQKMVQANQPRNWLASYLVFFMLLHNTALLTAHDEGYARKHGMRTRFAREAMVKEYHLGANILLAYFHYCNKGLYPFSPACREQELRGLAELDDRAVQLVQCTKKQVETHRDEWRRIRENKECTHPSYFISQMFEEQWQPSSAT